MAFIRLPIREKAKIVSVKLPISETAWILEGFILSENIIGMKTKEIVIMENIKSRIILELELVNKNQIKIKWLGEQVPKIQIYRKRGIEENWGNPLVELPWSAKEYYMTLDSNDYDIKLVGLNDTGDSDIVSVGMNQDYNVDINFELPINEKNLYVDIELVSEYRIEVNL